MMPPRVCVITVDIVMVAVVKNVTMDDVVDVLTLEVVVWPKTVVAECEVKIHVENPVVCRVVVLKDVEVAVVVMGWVVDVMVVEMLVMRVVEVCVVTAPTAR